MAIRTVYERSDQVGVFIKITNSFCIIPDNAPESFFRILKTEICGKIPIIQTSIFGSRCIGRLIIGNKKGIIVPYQTTSQEFENLRRSLPEEVSIKRCEERFSALGNFACVNDYIALASPDFNNQTAEMLSDVLGVEIFRMCIGKENLVGSYCILNNNGGIINPNISNQEQDELCSLLQIPLLIGTVNCGSRLIGSGMATNDLNTFCGLKTTQTELFVIETALRKNNKYKKNINQY
nr:translation initiation factor eIF6 [Cryptomonas sp.]